MRKLTAWVIALVGAALIPAVIAFGQTKPHSLGQTIQLAPNLRLRVVTASPDGFSKVKINGQAKVFELQFITVGKGAYVTLEPNDYSRESGVFLEVSDNSIVPTALWDPSKRYSPQEEILIEELERTRTRQTGRLQWDGPGHESFKVRWLFDVPTNIAKKPSKLVLEILINSERPPVRVEILT